MLFAHDALGSYRDTFRQCGLARRDIVEGDPVSLLRRLPSLAGKRFRDLVDETIRSAGDIADIEVSSGTTGPPKRRIMTRRDSEAETEVLARLLAVPGIGPGDSVACLDTGLLTLMVSFIEALDRLGVDESWAFSVYMDEEATVEGLLALDPTVVITIPSILDRIMGPLSAGLRIRPRRLRKIVYVGEKMREATRRSLEVGPGPGGVRLLRSVGDVGPGHRVRCPCGDTYLHRLEHCGDYRGRPRGRSADHEAWTARVCHCSGTSWETSCV